MERHFQAGECLLASGDGDAVEASLMSAPSCGSRPSEGFDRVLRVTSVHDDVPARIPQGLCARNAKDTAEYWTWRIGKEETVVCATEEE